MMSRVCSDHLEYHSSRSYICNKHILSYVYFSILREKKPGEVRRQLGIINGLTISIKNVSILHNIITKKLTKKKSCSLMCLFKGYNILRL